MATPAVFVANTTSAAGLPLESGYFTRLIFITWTFTFFIMIHQLLMFFCVSFPFFPGQNAIISYSSTQHVVCSRPVVLLPLLFLIVVILKCHFATLSLFSRSMLIPSFFIIFLIYFLRFKRSILCSVLLSGPFHRAACIIL